MFKKGCEIMFFKNKKEQDLTNIIDKIYSKDRLIRFCEFLSGIFIVALSYNIFLLPSNTVYGVGGIGVILKKLFNITPSITVFLSSMILRLSALVKSFSGIRKPAKNMYITQLCRHADALFLPLQKEESVPATESLVL